MQFILPRAEWANDALKAALVQILRRLDKVFLKISKKPSIRVSVLQYFHPKSKHHKTQVLCFFSCSETRIGKPLLVCSKEFTKQ